MKEEEQNFKEMIESEYRLMFRLMIEEKEVNFRGLHGYVFNLNLREPSLNQLTEFAAELKEKFQETLQVRYSKWHPHNIWEMRERRAEHCQF